MSGSILERTRTAHEEAELFEQAAVAALDDRPKGQKAKVWQQHTIANLVDKATEANSTLLEIYADEDGTFQEELESMKGPNALSQFYEALKATNEYHERYPNLELPSAAELVNIEVNVPFSGPEIYGKYLDLHELHERFCNLPGQSFVEYTTYLEVFHELERIPEEQKTRQYRRYVADLWNYLKGFFQRTQPLTDFKEIEDELEKSFLEDWKRGAVPGWEKSASGGYVARPLDLSKFKAQSELEALGAERLRSALDAMGLKCGGTLQERAARLWSVRDKLPDQIDPKLLAKKKTKPASGDSGDTDQSTVQSEKQELALLEYKIRNLCAQLSDVINNTRRHVEKQQTRTVEEKEAEILEEEQGLLPDVQEEDDEDDDEEGPLYNPLNLPLGWDGKPIPYWLYKLHGLGVEFKCEICGNQSYWGRRAFDRHFQEWRHAHGMRALGIPNTKHFHDITSIADAIALYNKLRNQIRQEQFIGDDEEEFEDTEGNVLNKRTYEDLARQGFL